MWTRRDIVVAVTCLVVGSTGQLVQYAVTPVGSGAAAADNVAAAVAHPTAMQWAAWLDLTILFFLPALVVIAHLARARTTRLGWAAAVLAIGSTVPGIAYLLAPDVLYVAAAHGEVATRVIDAYNANGVVTVATGVFLVGHILGMVLLGVALWRAGSVPRWAAVCLAVSPVLEIVGGATQIRAASVLAYLLLMAAFGACAVTVARPDASPVAARSALARS